MRFWSDTPPIFDFFLGPPYDLKSDIPTPPQFYMEHPLVIMHAYALFYYFNFVSAEFITNAMALTAVSLVVTIYILNIHHHNTTKPPPKWLKRLFCSGGNRVDVTMGDPSEVILQDLDNNDQKTVKDPLCELIKQYIEQKAVEKAENDEADQNAADWQRLAREIDRLMFWLFNIIVIITCAFYFFKLRENE